MYGVLTDRACRVFLEMRGEAFLLDHDHTGTEHLLIAIVEVDDDVAGPVLRRFGVTAENLRREVRALVTPGSDFDSEWTTVILRAPGPDGEAAGPEVATDPVVSDREFTPRLMKCLMRLAPFEAHELGDGHVGPEHLLLAILREGNGVAVQALQNLGVDTSELMRALYEKIADDPAAGDRTAPEPSEEDRQAHLEMRRAIAHSRMRPEDRVVFTSDNATQVFCVLDGIDRLYNSEHREETIEQVTRLLTESFTRRARNTSRSTPAPFTPAQERQILTSIVEHLRRRAADQLGD
jgi:ATP-dependent Clp protease ATP-binding subunit ClpC